MVHCSVLCPREGGLCLFMFMLILPHLRVVIPGPSGFPLKVCSGNENKRTACHHCW